MQHYIVHYGELGLKGHNRVQFERQLVRNIRTVLGVLGNVSVARAHSYLLVNAAEDIAPEALEQRLQRVFGVAYFAPTLIVPKDFEAMSEAALRLSKDLITATTTFKVETARGDKQFPMLSQEVSREIGARIVEKTGAPVKMKNPDVRLNIQIYSDGAYLFIRRLPGAGGLPVGTSGRVLTLLSGGIDSPVAAHMLLKRGCTTDFLHFHLLPTIEQVRHSKIVTMAQAVLAPHCSPGALYMVSAAPFEAAMAGLNERVATVVFRRFVMRVAERLAQQSVRNRSALALVTGESVGQVASQTLQNLYLISQATAMPILRPLIGFDKIEIIAMARQIGTYDLSIQEYKDPCSLHARHPATWARESDVLEVESTLDVADLVEETLQRYVEVVEIL
ncbi:MAG: tRNA 4-thiouridine(8) synthase ThiI [Anaerolineae bacterium]|nr:tRNA 4-thiouridine(8) synthase ThiI [Anaerolineae bacterium]